MTEDADTRIDRLTEAYVQGRLSPEEQADFECYFIDRPDLLDELELGEALRRGLKQIEQSRPKKTPVVPWELAAAAILILGLGAFFGNLLAQRASHFSDEPVLSAQIVTIPITRSTQQRDITIRKSNQADVLIFRVRLTDPTSTQFRVTISDKSGVVSELAAVELHAGDFVNFSVRSDNLELGIYKIAIYKKEGDRIERAIDTITVNIE